MPYADINGTSIYFETSGHGEPLFLLQGFTRNIISFLPLIKTMERDFQVIALDHRGSGRSGCPFASSTIEQMASDVLGLMDHLSLSRAHFFGHSMGGAIVQQIAIDAPHRVDKMVICSSFAKVPFTALMQIDIIKEMVAANISRELILKTVLPWQFSSQCLEIVGMPEKIISKILSDPYPQKPEGFLAQGEALKKCNLINQLEKIDRPCLILVGEQDLYTPPPHSRLMAEKMQKAQMKIISHQGHMITEEMPDLVCNEINAFIRS